MAFLFRKAFCSWLCPIGTISEYLWRAGKKLFKRNFYLTTLDRPALARIEIFPVRILPLGHFHHVRCWHPRFHAKPLWADRRRENVEFLPAYWGDGPDCIGYFRRGLCIYSEFLVSLSLSLRRAAWSDILAEPHADPQKRGNVYRLRQVRKGVSLRRCQSTNSFKFAAVECTGCLGMCSRLSRARRVWP